MGVEDRSITQPRVSIIALSPPLNGGILGASVSYTWYLVWPYADLPASFQYLGNQGDKSPGTARASVSIKETFEVRFEPVPSTKSNVKVLPTELYG